MNHKLEQNGFILLPSVLNKINLKYARECFDENDIYNYNLSFVNKNHLDIVHKKLNLDLVSYKYRASNNNNSSDAGLFHRDIHLTVNNPQDIYTCLLYLDNSMMEVIPKSHLQPLMNIWEALKNFNKRKTLYIPPGSILVFNSSLIHRGLFTGNSQNRRLIQQFVCIPRDKIDALHNKILHAPCPLEGRPYNAYLNNIVNNNFILNRISNFFVYLNVARGYAYHTKLNSKINKPDIVCISPETNQYRIDITEDKLYPSNKFVINQNLNLLDLEPKYYSDFNYYSHIHNHLMLFFYTLLFIIIGLGFGLFIS